MIATSAEEASAAVLGGAQALEIVAEMAVGGLTPPLETVQAIRRAVPDTPLRVMVRPHARSFIYHGAEAEACVAAARAFGATGVAHVVFGALTEFAELDLDLFRRVAAAAAPARLSMHRAIDHTADPDRALANLIGLADRVLCSGMAESAWEGRDTLRDWVGRYGVQITVAVGGGVTLENIAALARYTGAPEMHVGSAARTGGRIDPDKIYALREALGAEPPTSPA